MQLNLILFNQEKIEIKVIKRYLLLLSYAMIFNMSYGQKLIELDECINMAVENNHELKIKNLELSSSKLKKTEVASLMLPQISANGIWMVSNEPVKLIDWDYSLSGIIKYIPPTIIDKLQPIKDKTTIFDKDIMYGNIMAIQPIFMGGKLIHAYKMASANKRLQVEMTKTKTNEISSEIIDTYWKIVSLYSKEKLLEKVTELLDKSRNDVDIAIKEGVATKSDELAIRVKQSEAEMELNKVKDGLHLLEMSLCQKCGLPLNTSIKPKESAFLDDLQPIESSDSINIYDEIDLDKAISMRSEIKSLNITDTLLMNKERMELGITMPNIVGIASYSTITPNIFNAPRENFGTNWMFGVGINIPITGIMQGTLKYKQAHNDRMIYQQKKKEAEEKIRLQIQQQIYSIKEADKRLNSAARSLAHAKENLRYADIGYKEGVIPLLNLTMAQTAWSKAHDNYIDAWINKNVQLSKSKYIIPQ